MLPTLISFLPHIRTLLISHQTTIPLEGTSSAFLAEISVIVRCRAEELSQLEAIWIILVLGASCAVHLPGSLILPLHNGFYRLAPEIGVMDSFGVIIMVARGMIKYKQSFKISVKATLALRHALGTGSRWWREESMDPPTTPLSPFPLRRTFSLRDRDEIQLVHLPWGISSAEAHRRLEPIFEPLRAVTPGRLISVTLTILALLKGCLVSGTVMTNTLAINYALSYFILEVFAWTLLESRHLHAEAITIVRLMSLLDPYRNRPSLSNGFWNPWRPFLIENGAEWWAIILLALETVVIMPMVFWPASVIIFMVEFTGWRSGRWEFWILTCILWSFLAGVGALLVITVTWIADRVASLERRTINWMIKRLRVSIVTIYVGVKVILIIRAYLFGYTGAGTRKPSWFEWLG